MFRRLHIQMTFFCTLITSTILVVMTLICLLIVENESRERSYHAFSDQMSSVLTYLNEQDTISVSWIRQIENAHHVYLDIQDNGSSLFSSRLSEDWIKLNPVFQKARDLISQQGGHPSTGNRLVISRREFQLTGDDHTDYYACTSLIPKNNGVLDVVILYSLKDLQKQEGYQRLLFFLADAAAVLFFGIFSWFFTQKMIRPLIENKKRQTQFIAAASHELRSPLTVILSSLSAMKIADREQAEQFQETIQNEGQRMSRLINDMLTLANADNGRWEICRTEAEPDTLLLQTFEKYELLAKEKGLRLTIHLPDAICPPCRMDGERIAQVLSILIDNAFSYTPAPGEVALSLSFDAAKIYFSVSDTGPGIPDDQKKAIFERFYRADGTRKDKQHFGLGLCIAGEIIKLHKGKITVEDASKGGARFTVILPRT